MSFFDGVTQTRPEVREFTLQQLADFFTPQILPIVKKENRTKLFSMALYKSGTTRAKDNIDSLTGIVLDFDNKEKAKLEPSDITALLEDQRIIYFFYTTYSHTPTTPRWRLVVPFASPISLDQWEEVYKRFIAFLGDLPGIDHPASKDAAHMWFIPYKPEKAAFFGTAQRQGFLLNPFVLLEGEIKESPFKASETKSDFSAEEINEALNHISPDCSYDDWIKIGMALHHEFGPSGFALWNAWSKKGSKYPKKGEPSLYDHWKSFKPHTHPVTLGTLLKKAIENGFEKKKNFQEEPFSFEVPSVIDISFFTFSDFGEFPIFEPPPSLLREIYKWFEYRSLYDTPSYWLGTSIVLTGFLLRNHLKISEDLKLNFYVLALGCSGSGKSQALNGIFDILTFVKQHKFAVTRLGSYQGAIEALHKKEGDMILIQDEASFEAKAHRNKTVSNAETRIQEFKMKAFSAKVLTNDVIKGGEDMTIEEPFFCEISMATEEMLAHFSEEDITKGLLPRYLYFAADKSLPKKKISKPVYLFPESLQKLLQNLSQQNKNQRRSAKMTMSAQICHNAFEKLLTTYKEICLQHGLTVEEPIFARLLEHILKLSLLTVDFNSSFPEITVEGMRWAISVAVKSAQNLLLMKEHYISENKIEETYKRVLKIVKKVSQGKWVQRRHISRRCRFINARTFEESLKRFEEEGYVELQLGKKGYGILVRSI